jgi:hypothetical protein
MSGQTTAAENFTERDKKLGRRRAFARRKALQYTFIECESHRS